MCRKFTLTHVFSVSSDVHKPNMSYQMLRSLFHSPFLVASKRLQNVTVGRLVHYVQGQSPEPRIREYFYYIDHQGQLFLDDAKMKNFTSCFKEKDFLVFFFNRLKFNDTERYREDFPYLSLCGRERNYIRCDDRPIVFTHIIESTESSQVDRLSYNGAAERLTVTFEPDKVCMFPDSGRVYHPAPERTGGVGLVRSALAIELSKKFEFENGESDPPTHFTWKDVRYTLTNDLFELMDQSHA